MTMCDDAPANDHGRSTRRRSAAGHGQVVALRAGKTELPDTEAPELTLPRWVAVAEDHSIGVGARRLWATARYVCSDRRLPNAVAYWTGQLILRSLREITYPVSGLGKVIDAVYAWAAALDYAHAAQVALGTPHAARAAERAVNAKNWRWRLLLAAGGAVAVLAVWIGFEHRTAGYVALIGLVGLLDIIGRRSRPKPEAPAPKPHPLVEGMPTHLLKQELRIILEEEGLADLITISDVILDLARHEYHVAIVAHTEIKPELVRQIERRINAPAKSIKIIVDDQNSAEMTLTIRLRNPLENVPEAPWIPAGKLSAWEPVDLGVSVTDQPFELVFARTHVVVVGRNGSGKTKVHLCNIIDRLSACRDAVLWGIDLQNGPTFPMWRSVIQETAYTVDDADELLDMILAEMDRRAEVLRRIAEDDDPTNDTDEWIPSLGPALILLIDEFPQLSKWDGTKLDIHGDKPNLLAKAETIYRLGRKFGISLIIGIQKTGNSDTGSTVVSSQSHVWIVGPCEEADTVNVFGKEKRNAGYAPHLFKAATPKGHNDAGMALVDAPGFGADPVRGYKPFAVKARAMRRELEWREADNRPVLDCTRTGAALVMDAATVPAALAAVDAALKHHRADVLNSALVVEHANEQGGSWSPTSLAAALVRESPDVPVKPRSGRCRVKKRSVQCYHREDVDAALRALETRS